MQESVEDIEIDLLLEAIYQFYHYDFRHYARASIKRRSSASSASDHRRLCEILSGASVRRAASVSGSSLIATSASLAARGRWEWTKAAVDRDGRRLLHRSARPRAARFARPAL